MNLTPRKLRQKGAKHEARLGCIARSHVEKEEERNAQASPDELQDRGCRAGTQITVTVRPPCFCLVAMTPLGLGQAGPLHTDEDTGRA